MAGVADYQVEYEFSSDEHWRDVYVNYRQFNHLQVQAGKFKLPFSLDENTSSANLDFVYRSRAATQLAPGRDRGVMVHGRVLNVLQYEAGLFNHDGGNARTDNPDRVFGGTTTAGRATVQPFRSSKSLLSDLQFGAAFTGSDVPEGIAALRGRTALDAPFFPSDLWVRGSRRRVGLEARWRPGPFSVKAEYIRVQSERRGQSVEDADLSPFIGTGWYVSGTWLATGEKKASGADNPRRPIFRGGFGALEFAARLEALGFGSTADGGAALDEPPGGRRARQPRSRDDGWLHLAPVPRNQGPGESHPRGVHQSGSRSAAVAAGLLEPGLQRAAQSLVQSKAAPKRCASQGQPMPPGHARSPDAPARRPVVVRRRPSSLRPDGRRSVRTPQCCRRSGCS